MTWYYDLHCSITIRCQVEFSCKQIFTGRTALCFLRYGQIRCLFQYNHRKAYVARNLNIRNIFRSADFLEYAKQPPRKSQTMPYITYKALFRKLRTIKLSPYEDACSTQMEFKNIKYLASVVVAGVFLPGTISRCVA